VREERRREEEAREEEQRLQNRYGRTQNGQKYEKFFFDHLQTYLKNIFRINITYLGQLQSMGYPRRVCAEALKQSNNRLEEASDMLLTNFDTLLTACRPAKEDKEDDDRAIETELMEDATLIPQLIALGAEPEEARALLEIHGNRLDRAAEELLQKLKDPVTTDEQQSPMEDLFERARKVVEKRGKSMNINE
jgi:uncharacterized UBP type Zn finger protein